MSINKPIAFLIYKVVRTTNYKDKNITDTSFLIEIYCTESNLTYYVNSLQRNETTNFTCHNVQIYFIGALISNMS